MANQQFTKCVAPEKFVPRSIPGMIAAATLVAGMLATYAIATGHLLCAAFAAEIGAWMGLILYCENWLFGRLICLGGDRDAIGMVIEISKPEFQITDWDNDYGINLLLQCTELGVKEGDQALQDSPFGVLIQDQSVITALGSKVPHYKEGGYLIEIKDGVTQTKSATLHCEFEGSGVHDLYLLSQAMLGITTLVFAACLIGSIVDWAILIILTLAGLIGLIITKITHPGSPSDVNPKLRALEPYHVDNEGHVSANIVYVRGTWVYDPLHEGWNEIHPIKECCLTNPDTWHGDWTGFECGGSAPPPILLRLRQEFETARAEETKANQKRPEHQWQVHPELDGCASDIIL